MVINLRNGKKMMEKYYLVDYENVGSGGASNCSSLKKTDHLHIFYTDNSKKIDMDIVSDHGEAVFELHKVPVKSQSIDMHIVSFMGYLIGRNPDNDLHIVIISKDKDYDNVIKFWQGKAKIERKEKIEAPKAKPRKPEREAPKAKPKQTERKEKTETKKAAPKPTKSEIKIKLNQDIQKILSQNNYESEVINTVAKLVAKNYGKEDFKLAVHNELGQTYSNSVDVYNDIKPILAKYDKV